MRSGAWTYTLDDNNAAVQALNTGDARCTDTVTVHDRGRHDAGDDVTINGANDAAVITGTATDSVTEAGGVANGTPGRRDRYGRSRCDRRRQLGAFNVQGSDGQDLRHLLDRCERRVELHARRQQRRGSGAQHSSDAAARAVTVTTADGTTQEIDITINGANDAAVLSSASVNLTEGNTAADISTGGTLTISDVDSPVTFVAQAGTVGSYGTFAINAAGAWTYTAILGA